MYRAFLYLAFLALCAAPPPYSDLGLTRAVAIRSEPTLVSRPEPLVVSRPEPFVVSQPNPVVVSQPNPVVSVQAEDELDVVDSLGAGYSFFKKQPIVSRPVLQQKLAILEQPTPFPSLDDSSHQWSDYTRASAFKEIPLPTPVLNAREDVLVNEGYGQPAIAQVRAVPTVSVMPRAIIRQEEGPYGAAFATAPEGLQTIVAPQPSLPIVQPLPTPQPIIRAVGSPYGQTLMAPAAPIVKEVFAEGGYGQPVVETIAPPVVRAMPTGFPHAHRVTERTVVRVNENGYGAPAAVPIVKEVVPEVGYGQPVVETVAPPVVRAVSTGYGAPQPVFQRTLMAPAAPIVKEVFAEGGYGQPVLETIAPPVVRAMPTGFPHVHRVTERTVVRVNENGYGAPAALPIVKEVVPEVGYGQPVVQTIAPPVVRAVSTGYGQPQPELTAVQVGTPAVSVTPVEVAQATRIMPFPRAVTGFSSTAVRVS